MILLEMLEDLENINITGLIGFSCKRKTRNRKWRNYCKKGSIEKMMEDPFLCEFFGLPILIGLKGMEKINKRIETDEVTNCKVL